MSNEKRNREIFALHECGQSYSQLGIQFGLSPSRVMQIYKNEKERVNAEKAHLDAVNGKIPYTFLDALKEVCETEMQVTRIFRCLNRAGIINEIESHHDTLDTYSDETLLSIRNFGYISLIFARRANKLYKQKNGGIIMASIHKELIKHCPKCDEDVPFQIVMRYVDYNGIIPCLRCPKCNIECPAYSFDEFLKDGRVHIYV